MVSLGLAHFFLNFSFDKTNMLVKSGPTWQNRGWECTCPILMGSSSCVDSEQFTGNTTLLWHTKHVLCHVAFLPSFVDIGAHDVFAGQS